MKKSLYLYGAGGHAKTVIDTLEASGETLKCIYDDNHKLWGCTYLDYDVVGGFNDLCSIMEKSFEVIIAIARNEVRYHLASKLKEINVHIRGVRHPSAIISKRAKVSNSAHLMAGVVINSGVKINDHAIINSGAIIEHDCCIHKFAHIGPGASLAGAVTVQEGAFVGIGAVVVPFCKIGSWATVGAGAVVIHDTSDNRTVVGVPAKELRNN